MVMVGEAMAVPLDDDHPPPGPNDVALRVRGNCLASFGIEDGDRVQVAADWAARPGCIVVARVQFHDGRAGYMVKQWRSRLGYSWLDCDQGPVWCASYVIIGRVGWVSRTVQPMPRERRTK